MDREEIRKALNRAFSLGQVYWQQADDESYKQNAKAGETRSKFDALVEETLAAMAHSEAAIVEAIARQWDGCMAPMFDSAGNLTGPIDIGETIRADAALSRHGG